MKLHPRSRALFQSVLLSVAAFDLCAVSAFAADAKTQSRPPLQLKVETKPIDRDALREAILDATGLGRLHRAQMQIARG